MTDDTRVVDRAAWRAAAEQAREEGFAFFDVLTAVDREHAGFEVVLRLWDTDGRRGLQLRTTCPREDPSVETLTGLWGGAAWHERATAELFGLAFTGHDTAPLLLPAAFDGHPLRKDFVLASRVAKRWPGAKEPGESDADLATPRRRRLQPPGVPQGWVKP